MTEERDERQDRFERMGALHEAHLLRVVEREYDQRYEVTRLDLFAMNIMEGLLARHGFPLDATSSVAKVWEYAMALEQSRPASLSEKSPPAPT